jgi:hypothetical protein
MKKRRRKEIVSNFFAKNPCKSVFVRGKKILDRPRNTRKTRKKYSLAKKDQAKKWSRVNLTG